MINSRDNSWWLKLKKIRTDVHSTEWTAVRDCGVTSAGVAWRGSQRPPDYPQRPESSTSSVFRWCRWKENTTQRNTTYTNGVKCKWENRGPRGFQSTLSLLWQEGELCWLWRPKRNFLTFFRVVPYSSLLEYGHTPATCVGNAPSPIRTGYWSDAWSNRI